MNATETMERIINHGKTVADDSERIVGELAVGEYTAQGDVNFWRLESVPKDSKKSKKVSQLAPGTTKGSRHCIRLIDLSHIEFFELDRPNAIQGPVLKASRPFTVEHPEHGNQVLSSGTWLVTYQRSHAEELRRIED